MSDLAVSWDESKALSHDEARSLTDEVKQDAERLWGKLVELHDGQAHRALGYTSWGAYFTAEFGGSQSHGYRLLDAGRVAKALDSPVGERGPNERQARELTPLVDEPEELRETWAEVQELHPEPTAANVREIVQSKTRGQLANQAGGTDEWETPADLFAVLDAEFKFTLDVCATKTNAKCARYFTPKEDGLRQAWDGTCWMNPPYGETIGRWVGKAWNASKGGATVVCLVPARVDTGWWWDYCRHGEVRFLKGRLRFSGANPAPFPSAVVVFPRKPKVVWWER